MDDPTPHLSEAEEREVEERSPPKAKVVHAAVIKQGEDELERPTRSLVWSGIAAGFAIFASLWAQAALHHHLPDAPWREAVAGLGYTLGFLIVILGRMQLFTEHTMVAVLPLAKEPNRANLRRTARLWTAVFLGNLIGAAAISALSAFGHLQSDGLQTAMVEVSAKLLEKTPMETLLQGIPAGFLIASVAWIRSAADDSSFWIVLALTYAIAIGGFTHVVAGAAEAFFLLWTGHADAGWVAGGFLLPALIGNIIGGTGLFAMLAHAQVKREL
ncbi:MAG TPA: formate/nitrite transporter family protein [Allosphingosinicella sp.]|jgi:formate/nitrite transporter FocA (FNT family)